MDGTEERTLGQYAQCRKDAVWSLCSSRSSDVTGGPAKLDSSDDLTDDLTEAALTGLEVIIGATIGM